MSDVESFLEYKNRRLEKLNKTGQEKKKENLLLSFLRKTFSKGFKDLIPESDV